MPSLKKFLKGAFDSSVSSAAHDCSGYSPEFDAERQRWKETCTQDSVLADFTKYLQHGTPTWGTTFKPDEVQTLEKAFAAHANSEKRWDQKALESYLLTQIPEEGGFRALLASSVPSLWALTTYFAQWPFNTTTSTLTTSGLTFPELLRAVAFLCGRHSRMFHAWYNEDINFNRKTDQPVLEYIFRALAATKADSAISRETAKSSSQRDTLDILSVAQPVLSEATRTLTRDELTPVADRLSPPTPPELSDLAIPTAKGLIPLLEISIALLQHVSKFDDTNPPALKKYLEDAKVELQKVEEVSFDLFTELLAKHKWSDNDDSIYDAIAVLFNTLPNPQSLRTGKTVNWSSGAEESFYLASLRNLGLSHS